MCIRDLRMEICGFNYPHLNSRVRIYRTTAPFLDLHTYIPVRYRLCTSYKRYL